MKKIFKKKISWKHMETFGNILETSDEIFLFFSYSCEKCDYHTSKKNDFFKHLMTRKHFGNILETFFAIFETCSENKFFLIRFLDVDCSQKKSHLKSKKFLARSCDNLKDRTIELWNRVNSYSAMMVKKSLISNRQKIAKNSIFCDKKLKASANKNNEFKIYFCDHCSKKYKTRGGLYKHTQKYHLSLVDSEENNSLALVKKEDIVDDKLKHNKNEKVDKVDKLTNLVEVLITENKELQNQLIEMAREPKVINNNQTINKNKQFNIITFLNNDCKDAFNLSEFIKNLEVTFDDLEYIEQNGYVQGIRESLVKTLANMEETKRPIHCTDTKRKQFYVKDNDEWDKDKTHNKINQAINEYNTNQLKTLNEWKLTNNSKIFGQDDNPGDKNNKMMSLINEVTQMYQPSGDKVRKKIISDIGSVTMLEKESDKYIK